MPKIFLTFFLCIAVLVSCAQRKQWIGYKADPATAKNKNIVLVSGDEEYRSEEALPMLAGILSKEHGFNCTVLFAIDQASGAINPNNVANIPGLEQLESADLLIIFTRFRELPDEQMVHIDNYLKKGKPVIGIRTATHGFHYKNNPKSKYAHYDWQSKVAGWEQGFGKKVLGETWISHHGDHGKEGTRALINGVLQNAKHPVLNGVKDIWCPTDVYSVDKLPADAQVLVYGQSTNGMNASAPPNLDKSIMPVVWTMMYEVAKGKKGRALTSTIGAAVDLQSDDLRRMFVNACFWTLGLDVPEKANVNFVTPYTPTMFGFDGFKKGIFPDTYEIK